MSVLLALAMQVAAQPSPVRPKMTRADLNAMADACQAPRKWVVLRANEIVFRANPDADQAKIECMLKKISAVVATSNIGFIGNEQASEKK
ncbi:hypothetical protein F4693_003277 [Sphingomonas endophytica]|jgi:hypothetical protein|uniref:Uncharacterized protein n=1 Tax=Sphingomonas endophytica TaxID=869719 RepID=A0A7X0JGG9_9SPHN|nr:hypothetical protein [Sphingomonas endophytica]MBB6506277.1 hypothetical protein [Sphingomonas endophytica]